MTTAKEFDLLHAPLEGTNLIEASAGTGKTYTIAGLYVRLVIEKGLSASEILVVTFTEAATEELRERIRTRLREALEALSAGRSKDTFLQHLVKEHGHSGAALRYLREALRGFDQAAIFTIHGFCRRMLYENAFESGSLFDTELVADQESLKEAIVEDFWRSHFYNGSRLFVHYAINKKLAPAKLLSLLGNRTAQPYLRIIPQFDPPDTSSQERAFQAAFRAVRQAWQSSKEEVGRILSSHEGLNRQKYRKTSVTIWLHRMDDYLSSEGEGQSLFAGFEKLTSVELQRGVKKNCSPPAHPFFQLCEELKEKQEALETVFGERLLWLKVELFNYVEKELARRKDAQNIQSFDDLLLKFHGALEERGGVALAGAVRRKFKAALVDEFQDTDPVQYAIFKRIFHTEGAILFLIGDPKQAIYSFRGADVFTYMDAARDVKSRHTLKENWRSEPGLISAVNTLFSRADRPFLYDRIAFQPAVSATAMSAEALAINGESRGPFQLWFLDAAEIAGPGKPISKKLARERIPKAVAAEISRLLFLGRSNKALLGERPLRESDIAVLVRKNAEALLMQESLSALHIPSVLHTTGSLFDSHEATEMGRVLAAIAEPKEGKKLRGALATDLIGLTGEDLHGLLADETGWEGWIVRFKKYHDLWEEHGFVRMFRHLLLEEDVLSRLMSFPDGERRNTNVLHLGEVLHRASVDSKLGMGGLVKWLSEQRDDSTPRSDEHQLRLETDERAIRLVTIHKSKGLEYPVVFCPFSWEGSSIGGGEKPFVFHDEEHSMRPTLDLGSQEMDKNRGVAEKEELAEDLRLLYVALTRAKSRCYFVWGRFRDAERSAPAYLLHQPEAWDGERVVTALETRVLGLDDDRFLGELKLLEEEGRGSMQLSKVPMGGGMVCPPSLEAQGKYACRRFSGTIDRSWQVPSFSSLVSGQSHRADLADRDGVSPESLHEGMVEESAEAQEPSGIFAFPKGSKAGIFIHDVMEHLDFAQEDASEIEGLVTEKLKDYGFELAWKECLCTMLQKVLSVPLEQSRTDFTLSRVGSTDRLNELEFYFPLRSISSGALQAIFEDNGRPGLKEGFLAKMKGLDFAPARGFMKGFIDMVFRFEDRFFLVDWKSNHLGPRVQDYGQKGLCAVMEENFYILQYHIYALALHQYLRLRVPGYDYETHFGGVYYIFLRGVDPAMGPEFGIYRDRPPKELIDALYVSLMGPGAGER
jgi:exodeoxyribonuclease V beta subunit